MANEPAIASTTAIEEAIYLIRGRRVMLDSDLAKIYGVSTTRLNEQVKRNADRFPEDFAFQLTRQEVTTLKSQFAISNLGRGGRRTLPWVFTEHGAIMLASVLNSKTAVEASVRVVRAFVRLREMLAGHKQFSKKLAELEQHLKGHDKAIQTLFETIRQMLTPEAKKRREMGFHVRSGSGLLIRETPKKRN